MEEGAEDDPSADPFIVQERIFSKYAAMLYTSDNGKSFHEFKDAKYCQSCGEKVSLGYLFCVNSIALWPVWAIELKAGHGLNLSHMPCP